jgi:hypothetical protein
MAADLWEPRLSINDNVAGLERADELLFDIGGFGRDGRELKAIRITISESHLARAWYEALLW